MTTKRRSYVTRLSVEGARKYQDDFRKSGRVGQDSMQRIGKATVPASKGLRAISRDTGHFRDQLHGVGRELPAVSRIARLMGTTAIAAGLVAFGKSSLDVARNFEASMKRVEAATGAGAAAMTRLEEKAKTVGATTAFTASQAADAIEVLAKNGLSVEAILGGALDATVAISGALGGELAPSADLVTDVMAQFSLTAAELPVIADRITGAALTSKFGFDDLRLAIGQAGGVAGKFGVDVDDFLTALSLTASGFSSGSDAGTSFKTFLQRLTPQSKEAAAAMASIGFSAFDSEGKMKSLQDITENLRLGIAGLSDEARNKALQKIFGQDAIRTALLLADKGADGFIELRDRLREVSAGDQAEVRLEGLNGALRELASAWEALQLESAQNGGLEIAEEFVDRLTAALRYLRENFAEVEEIVERVAQVLVVQLVGRGLRLAAAKAIATRAAYIQLAAGVTGVGVAANHSVGAVTRLGLAGRTLTGLLGGPVGLALTAASLISLGVDTDKAADSIDAAEATLREAETALDAYTEATKRAAEEQDGLGGKVSEATANILVQSRLQLQTARDEAEAALEEVKDRLFGNGLIDGDDVGGVIHDLVGEAQKNRTIQDHHETQPWLNPDTGQYENLNSVFDRIVKSLQAMRNGDKAFAEVAKEMSLFAGIGREAEEIVSRLDAAMMNIGDLDLDKARQEMSGLAKALGLFGSELEAIESAQNENELLDAYDKLRAALLNAAFAGKILRETGEDGMLALISAAGDLETKGKKLDDTLSGVLDTVTQDAGDTFLSQVENDADAAAAAVRRLDDAHASYQQRTEFDGTSTDRGAWSREAATAAEKGILNLIGYAEGTDRGRGYNETLDYGRWTGGDVNLINMTLREVVALQKTMLTPENRATHGDGKGSSAVGRYQIVGTTLRGLIDRLGLSLEEKFTPKLQDRLGLELVRGRHGQGTTGMRQEWQGLNNVSSGTINNALSGQVIPTKDPDVERTSLATAETRRRVLEEQADLIEKLLNSSDRQTAQLQLENGLIGASESVAARARFMFEALAAAKEKGIDVDKTLVENGETLRQAIEREADAVARLTDENERLMRSKQQSTEQKKEEIKGVLKTSFDELRTGSATIEEAFSNIVDFVAQKLWNLALDPVFEFLSGIITQAISGLAGGGPLKKAIGGAIEIPSFAMGGLQIGGRAQGRIPGTGTDRQDNILLMGSRGEFMQPVSSVDYYGLDFMEAVRTRQLPKLASGGALLSDHRMGVAARAIGSSTAGGGLGGAGRVLPVEFNINVSGARGNKEVMEMVESGVKKGMTEYDRHILPGRVQEVSRDPTRNG